MGVSAILPTSATSVPKIVSLPSRALISGSVDKNLPKQHTLLGYHAAPSAFAANVAPFFRSFKRPRKSHSPWRIRAQGLATLSTKIAS
jgi:hypothetical protein